MFYSVMSDGISLTCYNEKLNVASFQKLSAIEPGQKLYVDPQTKAIDIYTPVADDAEGSWIGSAYNNLTRVVQAGSDYYYGQSATGSLEAIKNLAQSTLAYIQKNYTDYGTGITFYQNLQDLYSLKRAAKESVREGQGLNHLMTTIAAGQADLFSLSAEEITEHTQTLQCSINNIKDDIHPLAKMHVSRMRALCLEADQNTARRLLSRLAPHLFPGTGTAPVPEKITLSAHAVKNALEEVFSKEHIKNVFSLYFPTTKPAVLNEADIKALLVGLATDLTVDNARYIYKQLKNSNFDESTFEEKTAFFSFLRTPFLNPNLTFSPSRNYEGGNFSKPQLDKDFRQIVAQDSSAKKSVQPDDNSPETRGDTPAITWRPNFLLEI